MSQPLVPLSIFAGACVIAAGLYFGLAARAPAPVATPPRAEPEAAPPDPKRLVEQVAAQLSARKARYVSECWAPAVSADPKIATSRYRFQLSFDAQGKESARGISELRDAPSRSDVARCLRQLVEPPMQIPPPGQPVQLELDVDFP